MHPGSSTALYDLLIGACAIALLIVSGRRLRRPLEFVAMAASAVLLALAYVAALNALG